MAYGLGLMFAIGAAVRYSLMNSALSSTISSRVEVSTPLNSWLRVNEGVFLHSHGIQVYSGGVYHGTPIELFLSTYLIRLWSCYLPLIFIAFDLMTAALLMIVASSYSRKLLQEQKSEVKKYSSDATSIVLHSKDLHVGVGFVGAAYLFCPYSVASCIGQTTTVFANFFLSATLLCMVKGPAGGLDDFPEGGRNSLKEVLGLPSCPTLFGAFTAVATYQSFYPVCLLVPGILEFGRESKNAVITTVFSFLVSFIVLLLISSKIAGGWEFLEATYGFILAAPDLTPNIGLFWYFFTEMFEHFRLFFLATFQINAFVYVLPLATKLRKDPMLLAMALLALTAVFRSYPSLGDVGLYMSLLPMWKHLYSYLRQTFLVGCMLVATSVLGPIMYNLWIFNGSANANFYFAVTLAFNTAQIFLVTDLLFAHVKRQYHLYHGSKLEVDGQIATLALE